MGQVNKQLALQARAQASQVAYFGNIPAGKCLLKPMVNNLFGLAIQVALQKERSAAGKAQSHCRLRLFRLPQPKQARQEMLDMSAVLLGEALLNQLLKRRLLLPIKGLVPIQPCPRSGE
tara:strand:- start:1014 stop:1370 length:357 start_codon:yes stop_codon:yes gene_type:complete